MDVAVIVFVFDVQDGSGCVCTSVNQQCASGDVGCVHCCSNCEVVTNNQVQLVGLIANHPDGVNVGVTSACTRLLVDGDHQVAVCTTRSCGCTYQNCLNAVDVLEHVVIDNGRCANTCVVVGAQVIVTVHDQCIAAFTGTDSVCAINSCSDVIGANIVGTHVNDVGSSTCCDCVVVACINCQCHVSGCDCCASCVVESNHVCIDCIELNGTASSSSRVNCESSCSSGAHIASNNWSAGSAEHVITKTICINRVAVCIRKVDGEVFNAHCVIISSNCCNQCVSRSRTDVQV